MKDEAGAVASAGIATWLVSNKMLFGILILFMGQLGIQLLGSSHVTIRWILGNAMTSTVSAVGIISLAEVSHWSDAETMVALVAVALIGVNGVVAIIKKFLEKYAQ